MTEASARRHTRRWRATGAALVALAFAAPPAAAQDLLELPVVPDSIRVGLALSGGGAKGLAHIGVLKTLEAAGVHVDVVTGTSMGSVVGGLYAMGLSPDSIHAIMRATDWSGAFSDRVERSRRFLHQRRFDERAGVSLPLQGGGVGLPTGATVGTSITRLVEEATWGAAGVRSFDRLPRTFAAVATDIETGEAVTMGGGVLSEVMRASVGVPGAFEPFEIDGRLLVDGAVVRNLPASDALALGADVVICSDVSDALVSREELGSVLDIIEQVMNVSMRPSIVAQRELCDVLVQPDIEGISELAYERVDEWVARGEAAAEGHRTELGGIAGRRGPAALPLPSGFLADSVRVSRVFVEGATLPRAEQLVHEELGVRPGDYITPARLAYRLGDLDATGLFGLVHYRLDPAGDAVDLTIHVQERPQNRFGVGIRYDDERRAALLFTSTLHNVLRYGSVMRLDLRVGEETRAAVSYLRRRGVTGRLETSATLSWSQGTLRLPLALRPSTEVEITALSTSVGLIAARNTFLGGEVLGEWTVSDLSGTPDVTLLSVSGILDHESLDRIDFPRSGGDVTARWEWGITDLVPDEAFSVLTARGRGFVPLHRRLTFDFGAFIGIARGLDLPTHRLFYAGGAHPSAVFARTQPRFHGMPTEEMAGTVAQISRLGLRWTARPDMHLRVGMDSGRVSDTWDLFVDDPVYGFGVTLGLSTIVGPVMLEWGKATGRRGGRLTVSVGRTF